MEYNYFASCQKNLEDLLTAELKTFEAKSVKQTVSGTAFSGDLKTAYKACLWSRTASRILLRLKLFSASSKEELYSEVKNINWEDHLTVNKTFSVDCSIINSKITNSNYAALIVKDSVADYFRDKSGKRPSVDTKNPDIKLNLHLNDNTAEIYIDFSGKSLHAREYRMNTGAATLKENTAAAVLLRAGWKELAVQDKPFIDPMCGTGTLPIEAALIACNIAPGLTRKYFGFYNWNNHIEEIWNELISEAKEKKEEGIKNIPPIFGYDICKNAVNASLKNIENTGLKGLIHIEKKDFKELIPPGKKYKSGLIVINPPYGHRLGHDSDLNKFYENMGEILFNNFKGWNVSILTGSTELSKSTGLRAKKTNTIYNGTIKCQLSHFELTADNIFRPKSTEKLSPGAEMFANRLRKNMKNLKKWIKNNNITCYRIYDADMPEYSAAIDIFENKWAVIQEYAPPKTIDSSKAEQRLNDMIKAVPLVLDLEVNNIIIKQRKKQKGTDQYSKFDTKGDFIKIREGTNTFLINLTDYLDVGLFLDHRQTRELIQKMAGNKTFLNLFSYTGTASVYAARGGALKTVSIDNSNTYTEWAEKNMRLNGFHSKKNIFIKADCFKWLKTNRTKYDLIFLDPPTFSNSKGMEKSFDIRRDHTELINLTLKSLNNDGILVFSNNYSKFRLNEDLLHSLYIENITESTIPPDFNRKKLIHRCWIIRKQ